MECSPTLDVIDGHYDDSLGEDETDGPAPWGRLFPLSTGHVMQELVGEQQYSFGRGDDCEYCFEVHGGRKLPLFLSLSKTHFVLYKERDKSDPERYVVFIKDRSSNGTFVNGERIGRNKIRVVNNNDEIALATDKNKAFIFNDCGASSELDSLPEEFKSKYTMSKQLGKGACGEVKLAFEKGTCNKFAVKIISKKTFSVGPKLGRAAIEEVKILKSMQHPCIIQIEDVIENKDSLYIVLELVEGGELFDRVVSVGRFSEATAKHLFYQLLAAVKYLHDKGITHRDLKPENVLLASDEEETLIKVTDFGLSKFVGENSLMRTLCGTPSYLAPEVLQTAGTAGYSKAVDCWSLGVILYIMLGGYPPFSDEIKTYTLHDQICQGRYSFPEAYWKNVSTQAVDLIKKLLTIDPEERITTERALAHPWLAGKGDEVVGRARKLLGESSNKLSMPPPPRMGKKRPATSSDDEVLSPQEKPSKRPTIDTLSPMSEVTPTDGKTSDNGRSMSTDSTRSLSSEIQT